MDNPGVPAGERTEQLAADLERTHRVLTEAVRVLKKLARGTGRSSQLALVVDGFPGLLGWIKKARAELGRD